MILITATFSCHTIESYKTWAVGREGLLLIDANRQLEEFQKQIDQWENEYDEINGKWKTHKFNKCEVSPTGNKLRFTTENGETIIVNHDEFENFYSFSIQVETVKVIKKSIEKVHKVDGGPDLMSYEAGLTQSGQKTKTIILKP